METIKEAAEKYVEGSWWKIVMGKVKRLNHAFTHGVAWAERWIPVEEELPDNQDIVLVKTDKGCVSTAYLHGKKSGFICYGQEAYNDFGEVTHWRPIKHQ